MALVETVGVPRATAVWAISSPYLSETDKEWKGRELCKGKVTAFFVYVFLWKKINVYIHTYIYIQKL